jgi:hypothetical protein
MPARAAEWDAVAVAAWCRRVRLVMYAAFGRSRMTWLSLAAVTLSAN